MGLVSSAVDKSVDTISLLCEGENIVLTCTYYSGLYLFIWPLIHADEQNRYIPIIDLVILTNCQSSRVLRAMLRFSLLLRA